MSTMLPDIWIHMAIFGGILIALCVVGTIVIKYTNRLYAEPNKTLEMNSTVQSFRDMHDSGSLSDKEFSAIKKVIGGQNG